MVSLSSPEENIGLIRRSQTIEPTPASIKWAAVTMGALMAALSLFRHWHYLSLSYDMGFYVQDVWGISHGIWRNTIGGFHVFDDHFSPVLVALAPLGRVPTAEALAIVQAVAVATGVIPAFRVGARYGGLRLGRLSAVWYGLSAAIWHSVAFDFHPVTLGVPLLMWLIDSADEGRRLAVPVLLAVALALIREDMAVIAAVVLIQAAVLSGRWRSALWGLLPASIGVGFVGWATLESGMGGYHLWTRFSGSGDASIFDQLGHAAANLVRPDPIVSFTAVLLPVLLFPALVGWRRSLPGLLMMLVNGVADYGPQGALYFQYFAPVVPFIIWGAVSSRSKWISGSALKLALVATMAMFIALGPVIYAGYGAPDRFASTVASQGDRGQYDEILASIPADESVSATDFLVPHLAARREIYPFPGPMICPGSLILYVERTSYPNYVAIEWEDAAPGIDWATFLSESGYEEIASNAEVAVWHLTGLPPASVGCPSMEEVRRNLEAAVSDRSRL